MILSGFVNCEFPEYFTDLMTVVTITMTSQAFISLGSPVYGLWFPGDIVEISKWR